jgi:hypothetical protein
VLIEPTLREKLIVWYGEIADAERGLCRPTWEQHARDQIARLEAESDIPLAYWLEAL